MIVDAATDFALENCIFLLTAHKKVRQNLHQFSKCLYFQIKWVPLRCKCVRACVHACVRASACRGGCA